MHFTNLYSVVPYPILCRLVIPAYGAAVRQRPPRTSLEMNFASGSRVFRCSFVRKQRKTAIEQRALCCFLLAGAAADPGFLRNTRLPSLINSGKNSENSGTQLAETKSKTHCRACGRLLVVPLLAIRRHSWVTPTPEGGPLCAVPGEAVAMLAVDPGGPSHLLATCPVSRNRRRHLHWLP